MQLKEAKEVSVMDIVLKLREHPENEGAMIYFSLFLAIFGIW